MRKKAPLLVGVVLTQGRNSLSIGLRYNLETNPVITRQLFHSYPDHYKIKVPGAPYIL